jgi:hypothetical protein
VYVEESSRGLEASLLVVIAILGAVSYLFIARSAGGSQGFTCPGGHSYLIGPGTVNVTYKYSDALCGYKNLTISATLRLAPEETCNNPPGLVLYIDSGSGEPPGNPPVVYINTPVGVRPAYRYARTGLVQATACGPFMVEGVVESFYDVDTGLLLAARVYGMGATGNYTLRELELQSYSIQVDGRTQAISPVLGVAYASTAGVAGAALALAVRRLLG